MANFSVSDYGKYVSLQNVSGSGDPSDAPNGGIYLFASGSGGSAKLYLQNEGVSSPFDIAGGGTLTVKGDSGSDQTVNLDSEDVTFSGGQGLTTVMTDDTVTINLDIDGMTSATTAVVDADLLIIDDGANGTNQKITRGNLLGSALAAFSNGLTSTTMSGSSTLAVGGVATFGANVLPLADGGVDLGSSSKEWKDLYIDGVAYVDELQADQLGAALDANNQAITNVDINSGAMDGVVIGAASQAAGSFTTVSGSSTLAVGGVATFGANVLPLADGGMDLGSSSAEWKDLYIDGVAYIDDLRADALGAALNCASQAMTNVNIDSGAIDGAVIGANDQAAAEFTTVSGSGNFSVGGTLTSAGNVLPLADGAVDLGSSLKEFKDLYIDGVAYVDELQADQLGAALDANDQAITNVNIDSGAIDGVNIGSNSAVTFLTASNALITNLDVVTINSVSQTETTLEVSDKLIVAALSASSANASDGGLKIGGGASSDGHASILWDHANGALDFNVAGSTVVRVSGSVFRPENDNEVDLGASGAEFKDLYIDGVAYIDSLQADQLGAALDANNQAITNVDINSGAIDGTTIGAASQAAGQFTTVSGSGAATFASTVTAQGNVLPLNDNGADLGSSSKEWKDLYIDGVAYVDELQADALGAALNCASQAMTNVNIDSGAIDGVNIGSNSAVTFLTASSALITTLQIANRALPDAAGGANIGSTSLPFGDFFIADDKKIKFGNDQDASIEYDADGTSELRFAGAAVTFEQNVSFDEDVTLGLSNADVINVAGMFTASSGLLVTGNPLYVASRAIADDGALAITFDGSGNTAIQNNITGPAGYASGDFAISSGTGSFAGNLVVGLSSNNHGGDATFHGDATGEKAFYSSENNIFQVTGSSTGLQVSIGGDATSEYAVDVVNGSNNNNKIRAAAFVTYSDESLKSDVQVMNSALDTVMSLEGVEFTWNDSGQRDFGFIAQNVEKVIPNAVHTATNGVQGVDYSRLTSVLVEAVKAQQVQIEDLKKTITNLKK
tara:strand:- start:359 stop:3418 length:3060 start_codon:yes stop_codon:yes gene_type:complete